MNIQLDPEQLSNTSRSAVDLAAAIRSGELTSIKVTRAFLDRIKLQNPDIHAVCYLNEASALEQAETADRAVADGKMLGVLHGVPMTVKDAFRIGGVRSSYGLPHLKFHRPKQDCTLIARLRSAGAIIMGRTSVPFACFDWQCKPPFGPECVNPLDTSRTPGGSSGGAAAALAARFTPLELGTDLAGSIRYPAHCCGVYALRTSVGALPLEDAGPPGPPLFPSLLAAGPMARSLDDLKLLLSAIRPDEQETTLPSRVRIAITPSIGMAPLEDDSREVFQCFVQRAREAGHEVSVLDQPPFDFDEAYSLWGLIAGYEMKRLLPFGMRNRLAIHGFTRYFLNYRLGHGPLSAGMSHGILASATEYQEGLARREELNAVLNGLFQRYDLWGLPVSPAAAITRRKTGSSFEQNGKAIPYSQYLGAYVCPTVVAGTPALVAPIGKDRNNMPIAIQLHGPRMYDWHILKLAISRLSELFQ
ncbi:MAG: amidase [Pirellula sp.]